MNKVKGLYFHIPFCQNICFYCDFAKVYYEEELANQYLAMLSKEVNSYQINHEFIETIYIGGGTPSCLNLKQLEVLFTIINAQSFPNLKEFSIEVNPDSLDNAKIQLFKDNAITRISLGVQTFNKKYLKEINRFHTFNEVNNLVNEIKKYEIEINIDLMYGFNNQSITELKDDLLAIKQLDVNHVSVYDLILEEGTVFYNANYLKNEDEQLSEYVNDFLIELGYEHYEVSNYARKHKYSLHNLLYWHNERYYGFGLAAGGFIKDYRYYNTKSITKYLKGEFLFNKEYYHNQKEYLIDEIMLSFRIYNGIDINIFNKYKIKFLVFFSKSLEKNSDKLFIKDNKLYFNKKGQLLLNDIIIDFIDEVEEDYDD